MMFVAMEDPGLVVLPTHRLFRTLPDLTAEELGRSSATLFTARDAGQGPDARRPSGRMSRRAATRARSASTRGEDQRWTIAATDRRRPRQDGRSWPPTTTRNGGAWA